MLAPPSQAASQAPSSVAVRTSDHSVPVPGAAGPAGPAGRWIHCASNSTSKPAGARSSEAKLSLTEQPGEPVSIPATTSCAEASGVRETASG